MADLKQTAAPSGALTDEDPRLQRDRLIALAHRLKLLSDLHKSHEPKYPPAHGTATKHQT